MPVQMTEEGLLIDGNPFELISGSVQSWRLDPAVWPGILDHVVELGFGCIEVYVPWSPHEKPGGGYDFSGSRDIGAFLDLAGERGLKAIVRPGPHANAEITGFGYPERILRDENSLARGPAGNPIWVPAPPRMFPAPSYAGDRLYEEFDRYLEALAPILRPRLHPAGPVIALQADNEMTMFFRTGAYDQDYCRAATEQYREFIRATHKTIDRLNRAYSTTYASFAELDPPTEFDAQELGDLPRHLDWAAFKEDYMRRAVFRVADLLRARGLGGVPITHNYPLGHLRSPLDLPGLEEGVDLVGMDMYYHKGDYRHLKARCLALCGSSRFPYVPEMACGCYHVWGPLDVQDQEFTTLAVMMHGIRGFNLYMLVDRERWYGAPIRRDGSVDPARADLARRLVELARGIGQFRRRASAVLLTTRLFGRLENLTNVFDPLTPMGLAALGLGADGWSGTQSLGTGHPLASAHARLQEILLAAMSSARIPFDIGEPDRPAGNLDRYRLAVLPAFGVLDSPTSRDLIRWVRDGGTLVLGPEVPERTESGGRNRHFREVLSGRTGRVPGAASARAYPVGQGRIVVLPELESLASEIDTLATHLASLGLLAGCECAPEPGHPELDIALHTGETGLLWLANPTGENLVANPEASPGTRYLDRWSGERFAAARSDGIPMPPFTIRPLEVVP